MDFAGVSLIGKYFVYLEVKLSRQASELEWETLTREFTTVYEELEHTNNRFSLVLDTRKMALPSLEQILSAIAFFRSKEQMSGNLQDKSYFLMSPSSKKIVEYIFMLYSPKRPYEFVQALSLEKAIKRDMENVSHPLNLRKKCAIDPTERGLESGSGYIPKCYFIS